MDYYKRSLDLHEKSQGKLDVQSKLPVTNKEELSLTYTPGVAEVSRKIFENKEDVSF